MLKISNVSHKMQKYVLKYEYECIRYGKPFCHLDPCGKIIHLLKLYTAKAPSHRIKDYDLSDDGIFPLKHLPHTSLLGCG